MCNAQAVLKWFIGLSGYLLAFKKRDFWFWSPQKRDPHPLLHPQTCPHLRLCWRGGRTGGVAAPAPRHCRPRAWSTGRGNCHVYWAQPKQSRCRSSHELSAVFCRRCRGVQQHQPSPLCPPGFTAALQAVLPGARVLAQPVPPCRQHFAEGLHPVRCFLRQNNWNTCVWFVTAAGYEGAKYIGFFIVVPPPPPAESWV